MKISLRFVLQFDWHIRISLHSGSHNMTIALTWEAEMKVIQIADSLANEGAIETKLAKSLLTMNKGIHQNKTNYNENMGALNHGHNFLIVFVSFLFLLYFVFIFFSSLCHFHHEMGLLLIICNSPDCVSDSVHQQYHWKYMLSQV